jgi:hypothetical protein
MSRYRFVSLAAALIAMTSARADSYKPLDSIIDFDRLGTDYLSLTDPTRQANTAAWDHWMLTAASNDRGEALGASLNRARSRHVVRAGRFVKIPNGMNASDVARAWQDAGGKPVVVPPPENAIYYSAYDNEHYVSDTYIGTGFVCGKPGQPGVQYTEIWARRFLFVTADGSLVPIAPPKC